MLDILATILFWVLFIPFKLYFLWVNYKGRFRYGLWENSPFWRTLDRKIGVWSLFLDFVLSLAVVGVLSIFVISVFQATTETAVTFVLFGAVGWTSVNMAVDKINVEAFEKSCLKCRYKEECMKFHCENCNNEGVKKLSKSTILYEKRKQKAES
jgi:hypothetical protein